MIHRIRSLAHAHPPQRLADLGEILQAKIFPLSCLRWEMDRRDVIEDGRRLNDDLLYIVIDGCLDCQIGADRVRLGPGGFMLAPTGVPHGARLPSDTGFLHAFALHYHVYDRCHRSLLARLSRRHGQLGDLAAWNARLTLAGQLLEVQADDGLRHARLLLRKFLIEQILAGTTLHPQSTPLDPRIQACLHQIHEHCAGQHDVANMARRYGLQPARFRQLFTAQVGEPPKRYVQRLRLQQARTLLLNHPELPVAEVARQVGYRDLCHFHKAYRQAFRSTPRGRQIED